MNLTKKKPVKKVEETKPVVKHEHKHTPHSRMHKSKTFSEFGGRGR
jgi:hypothetical protein